MSFWEMVLPVPQMFISEGMGLFRPLCNSMCMQVPNVANPVHVLYSMQHGTIDILKPLGLSEDVCKNQLSPRSERAYSRINSEFDMLFQQLQPPDVKVGLLGL